MLTPRFLCHKCINCQTLLVASYGSRHSMVYSNVSYVSGPKNSTSSHPTDCRNASTTILKSLYGHNAHATIFRIQVCHSRPMLIDLLAIMGNVTCRKR